MISIVDFGAGNLLSVLNAFQYWKADVEVINCSQKILAASKLVLPGVGSFHTAMQLLQEKNLIASLNESVLSQKTPILGVCLGMQIMAERGYEGGVCNGLNWVGGAVTPLFPEKPKWPLRKSHVGFNTISYSGGGDEDLHSTLNQTDFYFCHSYKLTGLKESIYQGIANYGEDFIAFFRANHIWGAQFHPEKSQANGLKFIKEFIDF